MLDHCPVEKTNCSPTKHKPRWDGVSLQNAVVAMLVKCTLNSKSITDSVTSKAPSHYLLHGGNHTCGDHPFTYSTSQKPIISSLDNVHSSCFLDQASMFFIGWPSCLKVMMDCCCSLLIWAVLAITWTLVFYQIGLSSVYHPYHVTTKLIGSNALRRKEIPQINFQKGTPVNWNAFQLMKLVERMPRVCKAVIKAKGGYFEESQI